jgi:uncharacterized membrane protein
MHSVSEMRAHMNKIEEARRPPLANARRPAAYCLGSAFMAAAATAALSHPLISQRGMDGCVCALLTTVMGYSGLIMVKSKTWFNLSVSALQREREKKG